MKAPLLKVQDLNLRFVTRNGNVDALRGTSFEIQSGEIFGVVGESGSGKSVTALAIMGLHGSAGKITDGHIVLQDNDITYAGEATLHRLRGSVMSMIFQNPRAALNPIRPVGLQIVDAIMAHQNVSHKQARQMAIGLLEDVRIQDPVSRYNSLPRELSGGMCQRVGISIAIASKPALLIADEPTTGLDVTTQAAVLELLADLTTRKNMSMLLITHDLGLAANFCKRIAVMKNGRVVEQGVPKTLFQFPKDSYTKRLIAASPTKTSTINSLIVSDDPQTSTTPDTKLQIDPALKILEVNGLVKKFGTAVTAVSDVSFHIANQESVALVGESGSGKTTLSRMVARLIDVTAGNILVQGEDISKEPASRFWKHESRKLVQMVFQDSLGSINPRSKVEDAIADPLKRLKKIRSRQELQKTVESLADRVSLPRELLTRFPHQISGGQAARVGIARALAVNPKLIILDEPTAALDVSVQATVLKLLDELRRKENIAYLFVSHDLNVVRMICDRIMVMQNGKIVEQGESKSIFEFPRHEYTKKLLDSVSHFDPQESNEAVAD